MRGEGLTPLLMQMAVSEPAADKCHVAPNRGFGTENQNSEETGVSASCCLTLSNHLSHLKVKLIG